MLKKIIKKYLFRNKIAESVLIFSRRLHSVLTKLIPSNEYYSSGTIRRVNRSRINFELDISDYQEHLVYFDLEADSSKPLLRHIPVEDGIVLDIGANIGQTALWIANCLKKKNVKIIAFEPYPSTYAKLERNVSLNKFSIRLENMALGNKDDKIVMVQECSTNSGGASAYNPNMNSLCHPVEVVQTRLDTYLANSNDRVTFIKIDVEGYECQVLQGAEETIKMAKN